MKQITQNKLPISHKPQTHAFNTHTFERKKERKRERKRERNLLSVEIKRMR
jgi:hypothetical protein